MVAAEVQLHWPGEPEGDEAQCSVADETLIIVRSEVEEASPASFYPVNPTTNTGRVRLGSESHRTCSVTTRNTLPSCDRE